MGPLLLNIVLYVIATEPTKIVFYARYPAVDTLK